QKRGRQRAVLMKEQKRCGATRREFRAVSAAVLDTEAATEEQSFADALLFLCEEAVVVARGGRTLDGRALVIVVVTEHERAAGVRQRALIIRGRALRDVERRKSVKRGAVSRDPFVWRERSRARKIVRIEQRHKVDS